MEHNFLKAAKKELEIANISSCVNYIKEFYSNTVNSSEGIDKVFEQIILLRARYEHINDQKINGTIKHEDFSVITNQIFESILNCIIKLEEMPVDFSRTNIHSKGIKLKLETTDVSLHFEGSLDGLKNEDISNLLKAIRLKLEMKKGSKGNVILDEIEEGSIKLKLRLSTEDVILLQELAVQGDLDDLGFILMEYGGIKIHANRIGKSNEDIQLIYNSTSDCMSLIRVNSYHLEIESVNTSFVKYYKKIGINTELEDYIGMLLPYFLGAKLEMNDEEVFEMLDRMEESIRTQSIVEFVEEFDFRGQTLYVETSLTPIIKNGNCTHILRVTRDVTQRINSNKKLEKAYQEIASLKVQLEQENRFFREELNLGYDFKNIIYQSEEFKKILKNIEDVAQLDTTVLISGETGTGKELLARAVHDLSHRKKKSLIKFNCAALPRELIENELFGSEAGAFTGATQQKMGRFELAQDGSIFLDEIGELPIELQPKLLRILQEGEFERIGGKQTIRLNVRIIAATNRNLEKAVKEGKFRKDLYYRLQVFPIHVPPLRDRTEDILPLFFFFIKKYSKKFSKNIDFIPGSLIKALESYYWPGNVREMEHLIERAIILAKDGKLPIDQFIGISNDLPFEEKKNDTEELWKVEKDHILKILDKYDWKINGKNGAAKALGLKPNTLRDRMKKYKIVDQKSYLKKDVGASKNLTD